MGFEYSTFRHVHSLRTWYIESVNDTRWTPTRHGGYRRNGVAQKTETGAIDASLEAPTGVKGLAKSAGSQVEQLSDVQQVGGSNPSPVTKKWIFKWREPLGLETCPYVIRWRFETPWGSVRLHHWLAPDDDRAPHDHPWGFRTFVLRGGYYDKSPGGSEHLRAPATRRRSAEHQHTVFPDRDGAWTVIVTGPKTRNWGFWVKGKFVKMNKYFLTYGHHPCD